MIFMSLPVRRAFLFTCLIGHFSISDSFASQPFAIEVVDQATGRGVPLVELTTVAEHRFVSDSNGLIVIDCPELMAQEVFFHFTSHGYEMDTDGFGYRGIRLRVQPGESSTIRVRRLNIAERLYRITGAGIYRDSIKLGRQVPIEAPVLNAQVCGQDSVQAVRKGSKIFWFWGDTERLAYPLGNFNTSGATSLLPSAGGLQPDIGINLNYFTDESGFSRPMFERENGVLIWVDGTFVLRDESGTERIVTHYSRRKSLEKQLSHGIAALNEATNRFETIAELSEGESLHPAGQSFRAVEAGSEYIYFATPYPTVRVPANWESIIDPTRYEAYTPLLLGTKLKPGAAALPSQLDRDGTRKVTFSWKPNTSLVTSTLLNQWVKQRVLTAQENAFQTVDASSQESIQLHAGSIRWNQYRQRWVMIAHQAFGSSSNLGEVWYAESKQPEGPFTRAVRIVTHDQYSFYNVCHHDFLDQDSGRWVYFEGTYTTMFSGAKSPTPLYDYNQIMYRLDLSDDRLKAAFAD